MFKIRHCSLMEVLNRLECHIRVTSILVKVSTSIHESVKPGSYVSKAQLLAWEGLLLESVSVKES
jgi:hypothetical protein